MSLDDWEPLALAQLSGAALRPAILMRLGTDPVVRIWSGIGDLIPETPDAIETTEGAVYSALGQMIGVPAVNQLINGVAERVEFALSGVVLTGEIANLASGEAADVRGADFALGFLVFDADWNVLSPTAWLWRGVADSLTVQRDASGGNVTRVLSLSVGSLFTGRKRPRSAYWTDPDQKARSADDDFFTHIRAYTDTTTIIWPA